MYQSIDPTREEIFHQRPLDDDACVDQRLTAAERAYRGWRAASLVERAGRLRDLARALRDDRDGLAELMTREMGKPAVEARGEVDKTAWCFEHYADNAETYLQALQIDSDAHRSYVQYLPLGPVLGILPWNAPFWLAARCLAPALMAGNTVLLKHDPHVPACAEALAAHAARTLPEGVVQCVYVRSEGAERILRDDRVRMVSFTGSTRGGKQVAAVAGSEAKPAVLELGGSDPAIVLADADLDEAGAALTTSRMINAGQSCIAAKRILVERPVYQDFIADLQSRLDALTVGDPADDATEIGPLARSDLRDVLHRQVRASRNAGARCLTGGAIPDRRGFFYPPTLLVDVPERAPAFREETFGPVAVVTPVDDVEHAVALANDSPYGLAGSIWTERSRGEGLAWRMDAGQVAVNGLVKTDPRLPSGGVKDSGIGRELGPHGILEFVNVQQVWVG